MNTIINNKLRFPENSAQMEVRKSNVSGYGIFATSHILKGTFLTKLIGEVINLEECWRRINEGEETLTDAFQIDVEMYLDLDEPFRFFNHSCSPNAGIRNNNDMIAMKDIQPGEEITFDYSATVGPNIPPTEWIMDCLCESNNCRKIISNVLTMPHELLQEYYAGNYLQTYIIKELKLIKFV